MASHTVSGAMAALVSNDDNFQNKGCEFEPRFGYYLLIGFISFCYKLVDI